MFSDSDNDDLIHIRARGIQMSELLLINNIWYFCNICNEDIFRMNNKVDAKRKC